MPTQQLLEERGNSYKDAHILTGIIMNVVEKPLMELLHYHPVLVHDWVQMLSKLIRILYDPLREDSYEDLIGYATLCLRTIRGQGEKYDRTTTVPEA